MSQAGAVLLWETMRVTGLGRGLSDGMARWRPPRAVHDPAMIVADLAAAVALGGDCLADIAVLRGQPGARGTPLPARQPGSHPRPAPENHNQPNRSGQHHRQAKDRS